MMTSRILVCGVLTAGLCAAAGHADVVIETVTVGNPGNPPDTRFGTPGYGRVDYAFDIGKYEVTASQYTEFLNKAAATDPYGLYSSGMAGIQRSGAPGSYTYAVDPNYAQRPVNFVSFWDACRFANWLHNGQPAGPQGPGTTETGAYTLDGYTGSDGRWILRNADARWAVTSEDEWYKAAYHKNDGVTGNYWNYPTGSEAVPSNVRRNPDPGNNANFFTIRVGYTIGPPYWRTEVGDFENSQSPYGTFDQGGNVFEYNEAITPQGPGYAARCWRGGYYGSYDNVMHAATRISWLLPWGGTEGLGFRVSRVPEPGAATLLLLMGIAGSLRRRRAGARTDPKPSQSRRCPGSCRIPPGGRPDLLRDWSSPQVAGGSGSTFLSCQMHAVHGAWTGDDVFAARGPVSLVPALPSAFPIRPFMLARFDPVDHVHR